MPRFHRFFVAVACVGVWLVAIARAAPAQADSVDNVIAQLGNSSEKVRLSAVLSLAKSRDLRAVDALARTLAGDSDRNVRRASAVGLAKVVTEKTPADVRRSVLAALTTAATDDESALVRKQAESAKAVIAALEAAAAPITGKVYLEIGPMASKAASSLDAKLKDLMRKTAQKAISRAAPDMMTAWPGGKSPTKSQLSQNGVSAFYLDGTLTEVKVKEKGAATLVSCKISLLIATYPDKSMFAFLQGSASVSASSSAQDIELAHQDCVAAVVEDMVTKKAVAALQAKAGE